jgi:hypothetical protein
VGGVLAALAVAGALWTVPYAAARQEVSVGARPAPGAEQAKVKRPGGRFVALTTPTRLPEGTLVDVSGRAAIVLVDPRGRATRFSGVQPGTDPKPDGVSSIFRYEGIEDGTIRLSLVGGAFTSRRSYRGNPKATKPSRRVWGSGHGRFSTSGRYAAATVRGTIWEMADYANGSLCADKVGVVSVLDLVRSTTVELRAGQSYFARPG